MERSLRNPVTGVDVEILVTTRESRGSLFRIQSTMKGRQLNKAPFHYHKNFSENFQVIEGKLNMMVEPGRKHIVLQQGESFLVKPNCPHTFWNESSRPVKYIVDVTPARQFERALRINHALAAAGKASRHGTPSRLIHIALLARMGNTWLQDYPLWIQQFLFGFLAFIARLFGIDKKLNNFIN